MMRVRFEGIFLGKEIDSQRDRLLELREFEYESQFSA
jgi:hypothetical protein